MVSALKHSWSVLRVQALPGQVAHVSLARPDKLNAFDDRMWRELRECFHMLKSDPEFRAVVLSGGESRIFTAGLDLSSIGSLTGGESTDTARRAFNLRQHILELQDSFTAIENCLKPVIVSVHGGCLGAGIDLITACDIRYCSADSFFSVKEVDVGLAADVGTLQRLPKVVGNHGWVREICFSARRFLAPEAHAMGLITSVYPDREKSLAAAIEMATLIASKSPIAIAGTKHNLNYSRDHSVAAGLEQVALWNMSMLQTKDMLEAVTSTQQKRPANFSNL